MKIKQIIEALETLAPLELQESYDNAGVQVWGADDPQLECTGVLLSLDITQDVVAEALAKGCNMIVSHHPLIFSPLRRVTDESWQQRTVKAAIRGGLVLYAAHTNLDNAPEGVNQKISQMLDLQDVQPLETGRIGTLPHQMSEPEFVSLVGRVFKSVGVHHSVFTGREIRRVALCGGSGSFLAEAASSAGADAFLTGEMSYHHYFDSEGMLLVVPGHFESEQYTVDLLCDYLHKKFPTLRAESCECCTNAMKTSVVTI